MNRPLFLLAVILLAGAASAATDYAPTDAQRTRWAMSDMNSWEYR